jgi:hypothetical protein
MLTLVFVLRAAAAAAAAEVVTGSTAWIGRGLSCVCVQSRDSDARLSFDLTPLQVNIHRFLSSSIHTIPRSSSVVLMLFQRFENGHELWKFSPSPPPEVHLGIADPRVDLALPVHSLRTCSSRHHLIGLMLFSIN